MNSPGHWPVHDPRPGGSAAKAPLPAEGIAGVCSSLAAEGYSVRFRGFSAIDRYLGLPALPFLLIETSADIAILARFVENLRFPGVELADAAADTPDGTCFFRCLDRDEQNDDTFPLLSFACDWQGGRFLDPKGVYPLLRELRSGRGRFLEEGGAIAHIELPGAGRCRAIMEAALLLARYGFGADTAGNTTGKAGSGAFAGAFDNSRNEIPPGAEAQRVFLSSLLISPRPDLGLNFLKRTGFLRGFWPELAALDDVDHSKEFHPEGNVWNHTLETFRYRKPESRGAFDLRLSLGLLLHDAGKPITAANGSRRFDGHAELGAKAAARFLERLEFDPALIQDIFFLIRNHMLPAALKRLPLSKTAGIMASPLFPALMELYRCDESSSFKGPDGYYENSAVYQTYLKNIKNPYRSANGKKMGKRDLYLNRS